MINPVDFVFEHFEQKERIATLTAERDAALQRASALEVQLAEAQMRSVDERSRTNYHYQETVSLRREVEALQPHALVARNAELEAQLAEAQKNYRFHFDMTATDDAWRRAKRERGTHGR